MIKPINFFLLVLIGIVFIIAVSFTAKVDLANVNLHRDVSVLNQRIINISNIEEKLSAFSKNLKQDVDKVIVDAKLEFTKTVKEYQAGLEQDRAKVNVLDQRIKTLENRTSQLQQENQQLRNEIKQLQEIPQR